MPQDLVSQRHLAQRPPREDPAARRRMEVLELPELPGESLECLLVDSKGMSALAVDNHGVSSPATS